MTKSSQIVIKFESSEEAGSLTNRVRNFGEELYRRCEFDGWASLSLDEVDCAINELRVTVLSKRRLHSVLKAIEGLLRRHRLSEQALVFTEAQLEILNTALAFRDRYGESEEHTTHLAAPTDLDRKLHVSRMLMGRGLRDCRIAKQVSVDGVQQFHTVIQGSPPRIIALAGIGYDFCSQKYLGFVGATPTQEFDSAAELDAYVISRLVAKRVYR